MAGISISSRHTALRSLADIRFHANRRRSRARCGRTGFHPSMEMELREASRAGMMRGGVIMLVRQSRVCGDSTSQARTGRARIRRRGAIQASVRGRGREVLRTPRLLARVAIPITADGRSFRQWRRAPRRNSPQATRPVVGSRTVDPTVRLADLPVIQVLKDEGLWDGGPKDEAIAALARHSI